MEFVEEQAVFIVANGNFNPTIFQPAWLRSQGIITAEEEEASKVEIIHPEIANFEAPGLDFNVQTEKVTFGATAEPFIRIADIFYATFEEKLGHTPITSVGLNYAAHVRLTDWKQRTRFGRMLAPLGPWGDYGKMMEVDDPKRVGGVSTLAMRAFRSDYGDEGGLNVAVQPSVKIPGELGVFFSVNHHLGKGAGGEESLTVALYKRFDELLAVSREIVDQMTKVARAA